MEHGAGLDAMRAIKQTFDPDNRLNPGKMVDPHSLYSS
jgi:FAD/FMN-containing dehydrogenase